ncbi:MAG: AI-2E family transporter, partial [bacterium]
MSHLVRLLRPLITFSACVLVTACLYWGQAILIPIALAVLITFLLGPIVSALRRVGVPQTPAVLLVVILTVSVVSGIGWTLGHQVTTLAHDLPQYRSNIAKKIADIRAAQRGSMATVRDTATDALKELKKPEGPAARQPQPVPVAVEPPGAVDWLPGIPRLLTSVG